MPGLYVGATIVDTPIFPTISADQNDWAPTDLATAALVTPAGADRTLTGLAGGVAGRLVLIINAGAVFNVVLAAESPSSAAANRFAAGSGTTIFPGGAQALLYDASAQRWRRAWSR